jgi:cyclopropane fatty-acyl-phospholipid synthase-like methyltransferase
MNLICPACQGQACTPLELVEVTEQHRDYAPQSQETQLALNEAAKETALQYRMFKCDGCGIEFCDPMRPPSAEWYQLAYRALDLFPSDRWEFAEVLHRIPKGGQLFEFGCGSGSFLECCKRAGVPASGMDFSQDAVDGCVAKGLDVKRVDLNSLNDSGGAARFTHLAAFHFLEHIERPAALFAHAATRAAKGTHLWISVPSDQRPTRRMGVRDFLDQPPHHMTRWTPEAFNQIGIQHGWRLAEMLYEPIPLRAALWSITVLSQQYRRQHAEGRFSNRMVEKIYRAWNLPLALCRRLCQDRRMSGFSMLAHYLHDDG